MKLHARIVLYGCLIAASNSSIAQGLGIPVSPSANTGSTVALADRAGNPAPDSRAWTDPALNHNKLLQQQVSDGTYKLIGNYKVIGSSFLYGGYNKGDIFSATEKGYNIFLNYNTYNQELEFYSTANPDKALVKEPGDLDSFILQQNINLGITSPLKFVYGPLLGTNDKSYYEQMYAGKRFSLYKRYKSELGYASNNYADAELRQFDLQIDYYYTDSQGKGLKKLKVNASNLIKEFAAVKDLSTVVNADGFGTQPESEFKKAFDSLNAQ